MALPQKIKFKTVIQQGNRLQIPKFLRQHYKLETNQVLKIEICRLDFVSNWQFFYAKMDKDGRIFIPKLTRFLLKKEKPSLTGYIYEVIIETA